MKKKLVGGAVGLCALAALAGSSSEKSVENISISVSDYQEEYDINTEIPVLISIEPEDADIANLVFEASSSEIEFSENGILTGSTEGIFEVYVACDDVISNSLVINVVDITAREEAEAKRLAAEQAAKEAEEKRLAEEQAAKEAEAKRLAEEQAAKAAAEQSAAITSTSSQETQTTQEQATTPPPAESTDNSTIVWIDDTAKRYHKKDGCGMNNAYQVTVDEAIAKGKTPCGRCYK